MKSLQWTKVSHFPPNPRLHSSVEFYFSGYLSLRTQGPFYTIHWRYAVRRPHFLLKLTVTPEHALDSGRGPKNIDIGHRLKKHYVIRLMRAKRFTWRFRFHFRIFGMTASRACASVLRRDVVSTYLE
jgi:hypothetical protein